MGRPPVDLDPENYTIGEGLYTNTRVAKASWDEKQFRIDPVPIPWLQLIVMNGVFVAFFTGFCLLISRVVEPNESASVYLAAIGIGIFTCTAFTGLTVWEVRKEQKLGTWLIYDKSKHTLALPRQGQEFRFEEIVHLQYISTKSLQLERITNNEAKTELNLITLRNGERQRWPLLKFVGSGGAFEYLLRPLLQETSIPVVRVTDSLFSWDVDVRPYVG